MTPADACLEAVYEVTLTANGYGSYDSWKSRSDLDDNLRGPASGPDWDSPAMRQVIERAREVLSTCETCGAGNGGHERGCPESDAVGRDVDAEIDGMKEGEP